MIRVIAPTSGISDEDRAMIQYLRDSGVDGRVTCTTNHSELSNAGFKSRHVQLGTNGKGLGIDSTGPVASRAPGAHIAVFNAFLVVEKQLHELIYAFAPFNIKAGKRVAPYAVKDHVDHVHTSTNRGVFIKWPFHPIQEDDEMVRIVRNEATGEVFAFDGIVLRTANNPLHRDLMKWYGAEPKDQPWDNWTQEQIDSVPKVTPGS